MQHWIIPLAIGVAAGAVITFPIAYLTGHANATKLFSAEIRSHTAAVMRHLRRAA